jgi:hypothetical protein
MYQLKTANEHVTARFWYREFFFIERQDDENYIYMYFFFR